MMSMDEDQELLQDFLVEAGEILELLNEQLVDLEQRPKDSELLNAVFRGFHTIKGGASFLSLTALVDICHRAEDVFNALRNGERDVDADLMDVILPVVDVVNEQFDEIRSGQKPTPALPELLVRLEGLLRRDAVAEKSSAEVENVPAADAEFEAIIDAAQSVDNTHDKPADGNEEISEDEFEALLDQLHGEGKHASVPSDKPIGTTAATTAKSATDIITDDEFETLLDQLHGTGTSAGEQSPTVGKAENTKKVEKIPKQKKPAVVAVEKTESKKVNVSAVVKEASVQQAETTVRVDTKRLDDIMNMVGELVLVRNRVATLGLAAHDDEMAKVVSNLDVVTADLQSAIMKTRMQPIKKVYLDVFLVSCVILLARLKKKSILKCKGKTLILIKTLSRLWQIRWFIWCVMRLIMVLKHRNNVRRLENRA